MNSADTARRRPAGEGRLLQLVYYGYVAASRLALALPERAVYGLAAAAGSVAARASPKRRLVARNMARVSGAAPGSAELRRLVDGAYRSYARYWLETFRLVREDRQFFLDRFECRGIEHLEAQLQSGRGALVVVGHLGNWDAAGAWVAAGGRRVVTVAEVLRPRRMFEFFRDHRAALGITIHPAHRGAAEQLVEAVASGAVVALLGDRDLNGRGPEVSFFGEPATLPAGPASIALRCGVPVLVAGVYGVVRADGRRGWEAEIAPPIPLPAGPRPEAIVALTAAIAAELERFVAHRPEEWHMFQPLWLADRRQPR